MKFFSNFFSFSIASRILLWLFLLSYVLYPFLYLVVECFAEYDQGLFQGWTIEHWSKTWSSQEIPTLQALWNSIWISLLSTLCAAVLGVSLAFLFHTWEFPGRRFFSAFGYAPLTLPPVVGMFAFWMLLGDVGLIPTRLGQWFAEGRPIGAIEGFSAVLVVHMYSFSVYFYALVSSALQRIDPSLSEAAHTLGANSFYTWRRITLPTIAPAIAGASAISFMTSMGSFSAPYILANGKPFLAVLIYEVSFAEGLERAEFGVAAILSLLNALICLVFLAISRHWAGQTTTRKATFITKRKNVSRVRGFCLTAVASFFSVLLTLPQVVVFLIAFSDFGKWETGLLPPVWTLQNYQNLFQDSSATGPILNSLLYSSYALFFTLLIALMVSWILSQKNTRMNFLMDFICMLPLAMPGTVVAFSLLRAFNNATPQTFGLVFAHTVWLLPLAYFIRTLPLAIRPLFSALKTRDPSPEEAARTLGAGIFTTWKVVLIPYLLPTLMATALLVLVTCMGEFVASFMVYIPENIPIGVYIYQCMQSGIAQAAAYSSLLILLMFVSFGLQSLWSRGRHTIS